MKTISPRDLAVIDLLVAADHVCNEAEYLSGDPLDTRALVSERAMTKLIDAVARFRQLRADATKP